MKPFAVIILIFLTLINCNKTNKESSPTDEVDLDVQVNLINANSFDLSHISSSCNQFESPLFLDIINRSNHDVLIIQDIHFDTSCLFPVSQRLWYTFTETTDSLIPYSKAIGSFSEVDSKYDTLFANSDKIYICEPPRIPKELEKSQIAELVVEYQFFIRFVRENNKAIATELPFTFKINRLNGEIDQLTQGVQSY